MTPRVHQQLREAILTLGAVLGLFCIALAVASTLFGVRVLVFRSGSMSPTIQTGGAALARTVPVAEVRVGDIVSVENAEGVRVTHRVKEIQQHGKSASLTLKGDANQAADENAYRAREVDSVFWHVNRLGYVVQALGSPYALFTGGAFAALLIFLGFSKGDGPRNQGSGDQDVPVETPRASEGPTMQREVGSAVSRRAHPVSGRGMRSGACAITALTMLVLPPMASATTATFSDTAAVSATFKVLIPCDHSGKPLKLSWISTGAKSYFISVRRAGDHSPVKTHNYDPPAFVGPAAGAVVTVGLATHGVKGNYEAVISSPDGVVLGIRPFYEYRSGGINYQGCGRA